MKLILSSFVVAFVFSCTTKTASTNVQIPSQTIAAVPTPAPTYRFPAEWEAQESVWMAWPTYENRKGLPTEDVHKEVIKALHKHSKVDLIVQDEKNEKEVLSFLSEANIPTEHIRFHQIPHNDIWVRDMGPTFLKGSNNTLKIADFSFNTWGYEKRDSENSQKEEQIDRLIAQKLKVQTVKSEMISEGGGLEFNGKGTMIAVESVFLSRNPEMTRDQIEEEYKEVYNLKKVIWLKKGLAEDDSTLRGYLPGRVLPLLTTNGHADEFVRFVSHDTLLLAEVSEAEAKRDEIAKISRDRLEESFKILKEATDQDGKPFKIVRIPAAETMFVEMKPGDGVFDYISGLVFHDGTKINSYRKFKAVLPTSYLNFFISNNVILTPTYWKKGRSQRIQKKDAEAHRILKEAFPKHEFAYINPENINAGGGGLHCITQQQPSIE